MSVSIVAYHARRVVDQLALTMQAHLLIQAGNSAVAEGFISSRLDGYGDRNYGTLPRGIDVKAIIDRANPLARRREKHLCLTDFI